jgi:hypothetical protein
MAYFPTKIRINPAADAGRTLSLSHGAFHHRVALLLAGELYVGRDVSFVRILCLGMASMLDESSADEEG